MKLSVPALALFAAVSSPAVQGYSLWGPTTSLFEPTFSLSPMMRRQRALTQSFDDTFKQLSPRYEVSNNNEQFQIAMDVPGVKIEDVDVSVEDGGKVLTIRGHRRARTDESSFTSKFTQSFSLDPVIDVDNITANLMDGVLTVTAPKDMKRLEENIKSIPISPTAPPKVESPQLSAAETATVDDGDEVVDLDADTTETEATAETPVDIPVNHEEKEDKEL